MQLIIRNGKVEATHPDYIHLTQENFPLDEIIYWEERLNPGDDDPRTERQKKQYYRDQRRMIYPPIRDQLDMLYWDQVNHTKEWREVITEIKEKYPKPEED